MSETLSRRSEAIAEVMEVKNIVTLRFIGVLFSAAFLDRLRNFNDRKTRADFETGNGPNDNTFFLDISVIVNDDTAEEHC